MASRVPLRVQLMPSGLSFLAGPDDDLLASARRHGIQLRFSCRNGCCQLCQGQLLRGSIQDTRLNHKRQAPFTFELCRARALTDLTIRIEDAMGAGQMPTQRYKCRILDVAPLSHDVSRVRLALPGGRTEQFHAGQYLAIELPGTEPAYFSIASAPQATELELHIQAGEDWTTAQGILDYLREHSSVPVALPNGRACLASVPEQPLVLVAAGTGFAQMKSIVDYLCQFRDQVELPSVRLYWGVRRHEDMYLRALPGQWQQTWPGFSFVPVVKDDDDNDWRGHHEQLVRAILAGGHDWRNTRVIASGSPVMVYTLMDALMEAGMPEAQFASDVLEYAPR